MVDANKPTCNLDDKKIEPIFRDLNPDDDVPEISEIESLCMQCNENGTTRLLLTKIPFFKEVIIMSFDCPHCFHKDNQIQPGSEIQEKGIRLKLKVNNKTMMNRQIVKQKSAMFRIEELQFESPPFSSNGVLTTVEGLIENSVCGLQQEQPVRKFLDSDLAQKIDDFIQVLNKYKTGTLPFTLTIEDASGNSFIENPFAPNKDPFLTIEHYDRSKEDNESLGLKEETVQEEEKTVSDTVEEVKDQVFEFASNCSNCKSPVTTKMKVIDIPHFKEVIVMACNCDACGVKSNEIKSGGAIEDKGKMITLKMTDKTDLVRDVLTSETCSIKIPELDVELSHSSMGGKFTTIEGLIVTLKDQLGTINPFSFGDSSKKNRMNEIVEKLDKIVAGDLFVTIILDDPVGNSYIQNVYAPDPDPEMIIETYERTLEQNDELGISDLKTENYN